MKGLLRRGKSEYLGGLKVKTVCNTCGKAQVKDYSKGTLAEKRMNPEILQKLVRYWDSNQGVQFHCKNCLKIRDNRNVMRYELIDRNGVRSFPTLKNAKEIAEEPAVIKHIGWSNLFVKMNGKTYQGYINQNGGLTITK